MSSKPTPQIATTHGQSERWPALMKGYKGESKADKSKRMEEYNRQKVQINESRMKRASGAKHMVNKQLSEFI